MSSSTSPSNFPLSRPFHHQHQQNRNDGNETKEEYKEMENNLFSSGHDPRGGRGGFHFAKYECFSDFLRNPGIDSQLKVTDLSLDSTLLDRPRGVVPVVEGSKVMIGNKAYEKSHIGPNGNIFIYISPTTLIRGIVSKVELLRKIQRTRFECETFGKKFGDESLLKDMAELRKHPLRSLKKLELSHLNISETDIQLLSTILVDKRAQKLKEDNSPSRPTSSTSTNDNDNDDKLQTNNSGEGKEEEESKEELQSNLSEESKNEETPFQNDKIGEERQRRTSSYDHYRSPRQGNRLSISVLPFPEFKEDGIVELALPGNQINPYGIEYLTVALCYNESLLYLDLHLNPVGDVGAELISSALKYNKTLLTLDLSEANIGDKGAQHLGYALQFNERLTTLKLHGNRIGNVGVERIALGLTENQKLVKLILTNNNITILPEAFIECKALLSLVFSGNPIKSLTPKVNHWLERIQSLAILRNFNL